MTQQSTPPVADTTESVAGSSPPTIDTPSLKLDDSNLLSRLRGLSETWGAPIKPMQHKPKVKPDQKVKS